MSIANIISNTPNVNNNNNTLLYCSGVRCDNTCRAGNILGIGESTFLNKLNVYGDQRIYSNLTVDGTLTAGTFAVGNITANNITCNSITGVTGSFSGPVTATSLSAPAVTGTNSNFSGVAVSGSIITSNITTSGITVNNTANINNDLNVSDLITTGRANITNNLNVGGNITAGNNITCQTANINDTANINNEYVEYIYSNKKLCVPSLNTGDRDAIGGQAGAIIYNNDYNDSVRLQTFNPNTGIWYNIATYPQIAQYYLSGDEYATNATLYKIGSQTDLKEIFNSFPDSAYFVYAGSGDFKILVSGIYKLNMTIALQGPTPDFHSLILYVYAGESNGSNMFNCVGLYDNYGPYHYPNKEQKYQFECVQYLESGQTASFYVYQENDTGSNFNINVSNIYAPYGPQNNNIFTIQYISPKI